MTFNNTLRREVCNRCESPKLRKAPKRKGEPQYVDCLDCGLMFIPAGGVIATHEKRHRRDD